MKEALLISAMLALAGCGTVSNAVISDASLQEKAAFALNTTPDQVKITNRRGDMDSVRFVANIDDKSYQCYVAAYGTSDALCSGSNSVKKDNNSSSEGNANCNALLKAAGRC